MVHNYGSFQEIQYGGWTFCIVLQVCPLECAVSLSWFQATIYLHSNLPWSFSSISWHEIKFTCLSNNFMTFVPHPRPKRLYWISLPLSVTLYPDARQHLSHIGNSIPRKDRPQHPPGRERPGGIWFGVLKVWCNSAAQMGCLTNVSHTHIYMM